MPLEPEIISLVSALRLATRRMTRYGAMTCAVGCHSKLERWENGKIVQT